MCVCLCVCPLRYQNVNATIVWEYSRLIKGYIWSSKYFRPFDRNGMGETWISQLLLKVELKIPLIYDYFVRLVTKDKSKYIFLWFFVSHIFLLLNFFSMITDHLLFNTLCLFVHRIRLIRQTNINEFRASTLLKSTVFISYNSE